MLGPSPGRHNRYIGCFLQDVRASPKVHGRDTFAPEAFPNAPAEPMMARMRASLLLAAALIATCSAAGCASPKGEGTKRPGAPAREAAASPGETTAGDAPTEARTAVVPLRPVGGSGVEGEAVLEEIAGGVEVRLKLRNLPQPGTAYLAHIHEGTCAGEAREGGTGHDEHAHGGGIEHPLSMVGADRRGVGSSRTLVWDVGLRELLSGPPRHINVHAPGSGNPPALACGALGGDARREGGNRR